MFSHTHIHTHLVSKALGHCWVFFRCRSNARAALWGNTEQGNEGKGLEHGQQQQRQHGDPVTQ